MNVPERDKLLIELKTCMGVLEERSKSHLRELRDQNGHLEKLNDKLEKQNGNIKANTIWRRVTIGFGGSWLTFLTYGIVKLFTGG